MPKNPLPTSAEMTAEQEKLYAEAEALLGDNAEALRKMAILAFENRRDRAAMGVMNFVWGRNARSMVRAVQRFPEWFWGKDGQPRVEAEPEELLALFLIAPLKLELAHELYAKFRRYNWRLWQVREHLEALRLAQVDIVRVRLRKAVVREVTGSSLKLRWQEPPKGDPKALEGKHVEVLLMHFPSRESELAEGEE